MSIRKRAEVDPRQQAEAVIRVLEASRAPNLWALFEQYPTPEEAPDEIAKDLRLLTPAMGRPGRQVLCPRRVRPHRLG